MIIHRLAPKAGLALVTPENAEDLWVLRRIVSPGDMVSGDTSRVVKEVGDYVRPDKGERIKISVTLKVEHVALDSALGRLRILGDIISSSNEMVSKGVSHSLVVTPMKRIGIKKEWLSSLEIGLLKKSQSGEAGFILIAIDRREAGLGLVKGVHLHIFPTIQSGLSGKFYREAHRPLEPYFKEVEEAAHRVFRQGMRTYVSGPGPTKNEFVNFLLDSGSLMASSALLVEGVDSAGDDGVYLALHSQNLRKNIAASRLGRAAILLEEAVRRISIGDDRLALGFSDTLRASNAGAVESLLVSDRIFELGVGENDVVQLLNTVESLRGKTFLIDSSTDLGVQVSKLGGVVALLRYAVYSS
ncbi:MAG: mRNA surveillance protein Pelota [Nitrososphaerales archaeon]